MAQSRGLELRGSTVNTTADLATQVLGKIATKRWSMMDEWSSEMTLPLEPMLTELSTVNRFSIVFVHSHCTSFVNESPVFLLLRVCLHKSLC